MGCSTTVWKLSRKSKTWSHQSLYWARKYLSIYLSDSYEIFMFEWGQKCYIKIVFQTDFPINCPVNKKKKKKSNYNFVQICKCDHLRQDKAWQTPCEYSELRHKLCEKHKILVICSYIISYHVTPALFVWSFHFYLCTSYGKQNVHVEPLNYRGATESILTGNIQYCTTTDCLEHLDI